jgi:hypothetical protein
VKIKVNGIDTHHPINIGIKLRMRGTKRKIEVEYVVGGEQVKRQKGSSL